MKIQRKFINENPNVLKMRLSLRAKGLYFCMTRSSSIYEIIMTDGKKSFYKAVKELIKAGLVIRIQYRDHLGKFGPVSYTVCV